MAISHGALAIRDERGGSCPPPLSPPSTAAPAPPQRASLRDLRLLRLSCRAQRLHDGARGAAGRSGGLLALPSPLPHRRSRSAGSDRRRARWPGRGRVPRAQSPSATTSGVPPVRRNLRHARRRFRCTGVGFGRLVCRRPVVRRGCAVARAGIGWARRAGIGWARRAGGELSGGFRGAVPAVRRNLRRAHRRLPRGRRRFARLVCRRTVVRRGCAVARAGIGWARRAGGELSGGFRGAVLVGIGNLRHAPQVSGPTAGGKPTGAWRRPRLRVRGAQEWYYAVALRVAGAVQHRDRPRAAPPERGRERQLDARALRGECGLCARGGSAPGRPGCHLAQPRRRRLLRRARPDLRPPVHPGRPAHPAPGMGGGSRFRRRADLRPHRIRSLRSALRRSPPASSRDARDACTGRVGPPRAGGRRPRQRLWGINGDEDRPSAEGVGNAVEELWPGRFSQ